MRKLFRTKGRGFTLIELMIVIAIIAILAAILVPNFIRARAQSQFSACSGNLKNIATALELYSTDNNGSYPTGTSLGLSGKLTPTYLRIFPSCPVDNSSYSYSGATNPSAYTFGQSTASIHTGGGAPVGTPFAPCAAYPCYSAAQGLRTK